MSSIDSCDSNSAFVLPIDITQEGELSNISSSVFGRIEAASQNLYLAFIAYIHASSHEDRNLRIQLSLCWLERLRGFPCGDGIGLPTISSALEILKNTQEVKDLELPSVAICPQNLESLPSEIVSIFKDTLNIPEFYLASIYDDSLLLDWSVS